MNFCFYVFNNGFNNYVRYTLIKIIGKMDALKYFFFLPGCYFTFFNKQLQITVNRFLPFQELPCLIHIK